VVVLRGAHHHRAGDRRRRREKALAAIVLFAALAVTVALLSLQWLNNSPEAGSLPAPAAHLVVGGVRAS
jgi:hypothetical protein